MAADLKLVRTEKFGDVHCDFYRNDKDEVFMTAKQLGEALEYSDPIRAINKVVSRNQYLENTEFSVVVKLTTTDGKPYNTRIFTEDGIYEVTMLSGTIKAQEFRRFIRGVLKQIRQTGSYDREDRSRDLMVINLIKFQQELEGMEKELLESEINTAKARKVYRDWIDHTNKIKATISLVKNNIRLTAREISIRDMQQRIRQVMPK